MAADLTNPASPDYTFAQLLNRPIKTFECPSSQWSPQVAIGVSYGGYYDPTPLGPGYSLNSIMENGSYACIMGACQGGGTNDTSQSPTPSGSTYWQDPTGGNRCYFSNGEVGWGASQVYQCSFGGVACSNGAMIWKYPRTIAQISDGLSNTIAIGEQSGLMQYAGNGGCPGGPYPANSAAGSTGTIMMGDPGRVGNNQVSTTNNGIGGDGPAPRRPCVGR